MPNLMISSIASKNTSALKIFLAQSKYKSIFSSFTFTRLQTSPFLLSKFNQIN